MAEALLDEHPWAPKTGPIAGCPTGLEPLHDLNEIWIVQEKEWKEELKSWEPRQRFYIMNNDKSKIYFIDEETPSKGFMRYLYGEDREFTLKAHNEAGEVLMEFHRPFKKRAMFFSWMNLESTGWHLEVLCPPQKELGVIKQTTAFAHKVFNVLDRDGKHIYYVRGPFKEIQILKEDVDFDIFLPDEKTKVGYITRKFHGWKNEILANSSQYLMHPPADCPTGHKALLLGATFLIDYMCYVGYASNNPALVSAATH